MATNHKEAIILKGIASQILQMNVPTIKEADNLYSEFEYRLAKADKIMKLLDEVDAYKRLVNELIDQLYTRDLSEDAIFFSNKRHEIVDQYYQR